MKEYRTGTRLNDVMEFDHVIRVAEAARVTDAEPGIYAPGVCVELDADGQITADAEATMIEAVEAAGWDLMTGYTGQYGYRGPIMHPSEFVGGSLAEDILSAPGLYVVVEVSGLAPEDAEDTGDDPIGWVVARKLDK